MLYRSLFALCAAAFVLGSTVQTAEAYPVTARIGTTTVTGVYRPLDLDLTLVDGTDALDYNSGTGDFRFSATFSGTYSAVGYTGGGAAGNWQLIFGNVGTPSFANDVASDNGVDTITLSATDGAVAVGRLVYLNGGDFSSIAAHPEDTPVADDYFAFYQSAGGAFLTVTCVDGIATCNAYDVQLLPGVAMIGPYQDNVLDPARLNEACGPANDPTPCGTVTLSAGVPEPASLALVGLALGGLAFVRRRGRAV